MKGLKKAAVLLLASALVLGLTGCGSGSLKSQVSDLKDAALEAAEKGLEDLKDTASEAAQKGMDSLKEIVDSNTETAWDEEDYEMTPEEEEILSEINAGTVAEYIKTRLFAGETTVRVHTDVSDVISEAVDILQEDPALFWIGSCSYTSHTGLHTYSELEFETRYEDIGTKQEELNAVAGDILACIPENAGDFETALVLYDQIRERVTYDLSVYETTGQDIYGALVLGRSVCGGYAKSFQYLLELCGIEAQTVSGTGLNDYGEWESHAWNSAVLDGELYYFDVTWDDVDTEQPMHWWFGVTSDEMAVRHQAEDGMAAAFATYDNYHYRCGYVVSEASSEQLLNMILNQPAEAVHMKCADASVYEAVCNLLEDSVFMTDLLYSAGLSQYSGYVRSCCADTNCICLTFK